MRAVLACLLLLLGAPPCRAADRLGLVLDWFVNPDHAPVLVALQIGAYAQEGLDVSLITPADPSMGPKLVAAGQGDIALAAEPQFLEQIGAGLPLLRIGVLIDKPLSTLVALSGHGIAKLGDLRGRRIGIGAGDVERLMVAAMLRHAGIEPGSVQMVQIGEQLSVALLSGQVQAASVYRNFEPIELAQHHANTIGFDYEANGIPPFDELIFVSRAPAPHDTRLARFLRATSRGLAYLRAHPAESWELVRHAYPDLDNPLNHAAWTATLPDFAEHATDLDPAKYDRFTSFLAAQGLPTTTRSAAEYTSTPE